MAEIRRLERDVEHAMQTHDLERAADSIDQMIARLRPGQPPMTSQEEYTLHMSMVRTGVLRAGDVGHPVVRVLRARSAEIETRLMQGVSDPAEIGVLYTISLHGSLHGALRRVMDASVHEDRIAAQFHGDRLLRRRLQSHYRRLGHEQLAQRLGPTLGDVMEDGVRLALSIPGVVITLAGASDHDVRRWEDIAVSGRCGGLHQQRRRLLEQALHAVQVGGGHRAVDDAVVA